MGGTAVLIVEVVGVLPDIEGEQGLVASGDGVAGIGLLGDVKGAFFIGGEPYPAAAEEGDALGLELGLEGVEGAPLLLDLTEQLAAGLLGIGGELGEVEVVVEHLTGIVVQGAGGLLHDLFKGQGVKRCPGSELVQVIHIGLQVLAVMVAQCLGADDWLEGLWCVG